MGQSRGCSSSFAERVPLFTPHRPVCLAHAWALVEQSRQEGTPDASRARSPAPRGRPPRPHRAELSPPCVASDSESQPRSRPQQTSAQCPGRGQAPPPAPSPFLRTFVSLVGAGLGAGLPVASESRDTRRGWGRQRVGGPHSSSAGPAQQGALAPKKAQGRQGNRSDRSGWLATAPRVSLTQGFAQLTWA